MDPDVSRSVDRTPEEIEWDEEFRTEKEPGVTSDLRGLARFVIRLPGALIQMPMAVVPDETAYHARAAAREGFLAARSLLSAIADTVEEFLAEPGPKPSEGAVKGPAGTWGTAPAAPTAGTSSPKVKRIEVSEEVVKVEPPIDPDELQPS